MPLFIKQIASILIDGSSLSINSRSEPVPIELAEAVPQQDDLTLEAVIVDSNRQEFKDRIDGNNHGKRLRLDAEL